MKKILMLSLAMIAGYGALAQVKHKTDYMSITIYEFHGITIGSRHNMIVTRTDSAQEQKDIDLRAHGKLKGYLAMHEDTLMKALKPYFDGGWKLVSASVEVSDLQGNDFDKTYRYYLSREQ
ncbi:MAG: hypothetical protein JST32_16035 [Bacteroidetes bacterium]|nr:hypothetical protein [Bacteroidota bacterium]